MKNSIALGTFDGVHLGHRQVLDLPEDSNKIAVIFAQPPKVELSGISELIMSYEDKCRVLKNIGINEIVTLEFGKIRDMKPDEFLLFIKEKYSPYLISCGFNYKFGKDAKGNTETLKNFCESNNIEFKCSPPEKRGDTVISSSKIRMLLKNGEMEKANSLLSEDFSFTAEVMYGDQRGRTIGFPTINQQYPDFLVKLKFGVYKSKVIIKGEEYNGITNIGVRPTYRSDYIISETYIDRFSGDLYGKNVTIMPQHFIRDEVKFSSIEKLREQIKTDIDSIF